VREDDGSLESDLLRYWQVDLLDFWRGGLSVRRLSKLVATLPTDSATTRRFSKSEKGWDLHAFLLADLFHAFTGSEHPSRPQPAASSKSSRYAETRAALEAQRARRAAQQQSV
jgi:hypothetical protein